MPTVSLPRKDGSTIFATGTLNNLPKFTKYWEGTENCRIHIYPEILGFESLWGFLCIYITCQYVFLQGKVDNVCAIAWQLVEVILQLKMANTVTESSCSKVSL